MTRLNIFLLTLAVFCGLALFSRPLVVQAADAGAADQSQPAETSAGEEIGKQLGAAAGNQGAGFSQPEDPQTVIAGTIRVILGLLGMLFLSLTIYGGFLWMTAAGNEEQAGKAKKTLTYAVIGVMIILSAYSITFFVFRVALRPAEPSSGIRLQTPDVGQDNYYFKR